MPYFEKSFEKSITNAMNDSTRLIFDTIIFISVRSYVDC